jgi:prepilin-type N-terminal cleavage/methylation domain-containing protein
MNDRSTDREPGPRQSGFTLLEVLGAVAILGLWYVVLASLAVNGLRAEGESNRRLHASLLADEIISGFEAQMMTGHAPPLANDESERGDFRVRIEVSPFELPPTLAPTEAATGPNRRSRATQSLLTSTPQAPGTLRTIRVEVAWQEGFEQRSVTRTTYAFDLEAARPLLEPYDPEPAEPDRDEESR